jgi:hypothetical protein
MAMTMDSDSNQAATAYDQAIADYRQTVLIGFQQVEDNKAALRILEHDALVQHSAGAAAQKHFETRDSTLVSFNLNNEICKFRRPIEN